MEKRDRQTAEEGNTLTRELFVDANADELPAEKMLDIEEEDEDDEDSSNGE